MTDTSRPTSFRARYRLLLLLLCLQPVVAAETDLSLTFATLTHASLRLEDVSLQLEQTPNDTYQVTLTAGRVELPAGHGFSQVRIECRAGLSLTALDCRDGHIQFAHEATGKVSGQLAFHYHFQHGLRQARLTSLPVAGGRVTASLEGPAPGWQLRADVRDVQLEAVDKLLDAFGVAGPAEPVGGQLSGDITLTDWPVTSLQAQLQFREVNYSATNVAQSLSGNARIDMRREGRDWQSELRVAADGGELYLVPPLAQFEQPPGFYIAIGEQPLTLDAVFGYDSGQSRLVIQDMDFVHPDVMRLNLAGRMRLQPEFLLEGLSVRMPLTQLEQVYPVYLQPWLIVTPYNDLAVDGRAGLELGYSDGNINAVALTLEQADFADQRDRFAVTDLTTDIQLTAQRRHQSRVSWGGLDIYRIGLGAGAIDLASEDLNIAVTRWQDVPLLDGRLRIDELDLQDVGRPDFKLRLAGAVESVSLPALTAALDWPRLGGTLSGDLSGLVYTDGDIRMDGELLVRMFDGRVTIRELQVLNLFGNLPVLKADIGVEAVDLEQLTETFAFGKITGGLSGYIRDLRLENWQPVAFDASLSTLEDGDKRHRISQKALNNLSQIGGGLRGALSRGFLAYFDEYSYGELGLSCRLANGFCELGGVKSYEQGHYLLTRGGLLPPWVEVKLGGSVISWDGLIQGFEQIAQGEVKIN